MFPVNDTAMAQIGLASEPEAAKALSPRSIHENDDLHGPAIPGQEKAHMAHSTHSSMSSKGADDNIRSY